MNKLILILFFIINILMIHFNIDLFKTIRNNEYIIEFGILIIIILQSLNFQDIKENIFSLKFYYKLTEFKLWIAFHKKAFVIIVVVSFIIISIQLLGYWEILALIFIKFGLGIKLKGITTFAGALIKIGGKKVLLYSTIGMLFKRYLLDIFSKFFIKHSVTRYKNTLIYIIKLKINDIKNASLIKKINAMLGAFISIPVVYLFWTKFLSVAIQKITYAFIYPILTLLLNIFTSSFNFLSTFFMSLFELLLLSFIIEFLKKFDFGKIILKKIDNFFNLIWEAILLFDKLLNIYELSPRTQLIIYSNKINKSLENYIDKGINSIKKINRNRLRYISIIEKISQKRYNYKLSKKRVYNKTTIYKKMKKLFFINILKQNNYDYKSKREERLKKKNSRNNKLNKKREERLNRKKRYIIKRHMPFNNITNYYHNPHNQ